MKTLFEGRGDSLSVLSWNILAQCYFAEQLRQAPMHYTHVKQEMKLWPNRRKLIVENLISSNADIICLQECEFAAFTSDFLPELAALGYDGRSQNDKKSRTADPRHAQGVATLWRTDKYKLVGECHRSRTSVMVLEDAYSRRLGVVNCHLDGHPSKVVARVKQLQTTLRELQNKHSHHGLVIAGDFNCQVWVRSFFAKTSTQRVFYQTME